MVLNPYVGMGIAALLYCITLFWKVLNLLHKLAKQQFHVNVIVYKTLSIYGSSMGRLKGYLEKIAVQWSLYLTWDWRVFSLIHTCLSNLEILYEIMQTRFNFSNKIKLRICTLLFINKRPSIRNLGEKEKERFTPALRENLSHCLSASLLNKSYMIGVHF